MDDFVNLMNNQQPNMQEGFTANQPSNPTAPTPTAPAAPVNNDFIVANPATNPTQPTQSAAPVAPQAPAAQPTQPTAPVNENQPTGQAQFAPVQVADPYEEKGGVRTVRGEFDKWLDEKYPVIEEPKLTEAEQKDPKTFMDFMQKIQQTNTQNFKNEQARVAAKDEFETQIFEPVYTAFPKLRMDKTTDTMARMLYRGASASNPNISPVKVVAALSNFVKTVFEAGAKSAAANRSSIPSAPAGGQGRAATTILNRDAVEKAAGSGDIDDVAKMISSMQGRGVGGL